MSKEFNPFNQPQESAEKMSFAEKKLAKEKAGVVTESGHLIRMIESGDSKLIENAAGRLAELAVKLEKENLRLKEESNYLSRSVEKLESESKSLGGARQKEKIGNIEINCNWDDDEDWKLYEISVAEINDENDSNKNKYPGYARLSNDPIIAKEIFSKVVESAKEGKDVNQVYADLQKYIKESRESE